MQNDIHVSQWRDEIRTKTKNAGSGNPFDGFVYRSKDHNLSDYPGDFFRGIDFTITNIETLVSEWQKLQEVSLII